MRTRKATIAIAAALALAAVPAVSAQAAEIPGPIKPGELKWVLPPDNEYSLAYHDVKAGATAMEYETVENDDLTYNPSPRP